MCMIALIALIGTGPAFSEVVTAKIISAPFGRFAYTMASAFEDISKKYYPDLNVSIEEGFGLIYNMKKIHAATPEQKKNTIILSADASIWMAQNAKGAFKEKIGLDVVPLCNSVVTSTFFMSFSPDIKSMADFAGKTVAIGKKVQQSYGQFLWYYMDIGWNLAGKTKVEWVGNTASISALKDGLAVAAPAGVYLNPVNYDLVPDPLTQEVISIRDKVYYVAPGKEALDKIRAKTGLPNKYVDIPPGSLKGQTKTLTTHASIDCWAASKDLPEDVAYHFVKMLIKHAGKLKSYHNMGRLVTQESLCFGWKPEELHPGAYKAYKEAGLMK